MEMDAAKSPLEEFLIGNPLNSSSIFQKVIYENLLAYCRRCQMQRHNEKACIWNDEKKIIQDSKKIEDQKQGKIWVKKSQTVKKDVKGKESIDDNEIEKEDMHCYGEPSNADGAEFSIGEVPGQDPMNDIQTLVLVSEKALEDGEVRVQEKGQARDTEVVRIMEEDYQGLIIENAYHLPPPSKVVQFIEEAYQVELGFMVSHDVVEPVTTQDYLNVEAVQEVELEEEVEDIDPNEECTKSENDMMDRGLNRYNGKEIASDSDVTGEQTQELKINSVRRSKSSKPSRLTFDE